MTVRRVQRPALTRRLRAVLDRGSLFLIAPAGYGKTMALEEALEGRPEAVARVKCGPADRDPGRLVDHLIGALRVAAPGIADVLGDLLAGAFGQVEPEAAARELVEEIERLLVDPLIVVFEDAEHVAEDAAAASVVGALIASKAEALRVAVASRRPLPLRLAKERAAGRLTIIGASDLAFSADECEEMMRLGGIVELGDERVQTAIQTTEGWPLGLALAIGAGLESGSTAITGKVGREFAELLSEEVLEGLEPDFRAQLLRSSLAPELTAGLLGPLDLDPRFLDVAAREHLFLRRVPGSDERFAYHPLFREFLLERLAEEVDEAAKGRLHAALAAAIATERPLEAAEHWLAADREPEAVKLLGRNAQPLVRSSPALARAWIGRLSVAGRSEPAIRLIEGQLAMGDGRPDDAAPLLRAAAEEWAKRGSRAAWAARFSLAQALIVLGRFDEVPALAEGFDAPEAADAVAAPMVALWASIALGGSGRFAAGEALLERARAHPLGRLIEPIAIAWPGCLIDLPTGRLDVALERLQRGASLLEGQDPVRWLPYVLIYTAYARDARGEHEAAVAALERSRATTRRYGLGDYPQAVASAMKAELDARAGRVAEAELELARAAPHLRGLWHGYAVDVARAELAARRGDDGSVLEAAERAHALVARGYLSERVRAITALAPLYARSGATGRARVVVEEALAACAAADEVSAPRLLALRAWLGRSDGGEGRLDDLCSAWEFAGDDRRYLVRGEWARIESLAWAAVEAGRLHPAEVVAAVRDAFPDGEALLRLLDHPRAEIRAAAASAVAGSGHPEAGPLLARLAADPDPAVAAAARGAAELLRSEPPPLHFILFGGFELRRGGRAVGEEEWERKLAARLVRFLLICRDAAVPEDLLFETFWPGKQPGAARRSLQVAVSVARAVLDPPEAPASRLRVHERTYRLVLRADDSVDTDVFERAASAALAERGRGRRAALETAAALWGGDPLPEERYEPWAALWRERLLDLHRELLSETARACFSASDPFGAAAAGRRLLELDPLDEVAHRTLMLAYARSGRRGHALRQFLVCRRALIDGFGVEPEERTAALQRAILAGEPA